MQTANDIFIAQQNACANAGEQRRDHEGMPGMMQNDHRAKDHHTGTGDARQKADQHHQRVKLAIARISPAVASADVSNIGRKREGR